MPYIPQTWFDGAAGGTPLSAARLNYMETGIDAVDTETVHVTGAETVAGVKTITSQPILTAGVHTRSTATTAPLGTELLTNGSLASDATGWTVGAGWTWTATPGRFVHTTGNVATISQNIAVTAGDRIQVTWGQPAGSAGTLTFSIGAVSAPVLNWYDPRSVLITAGATGSLSFAVTPSTGYNGSLNLFTAKKITGDSVPAAVLADSAGTVQAEVRASGDNVAFGNLAQRSLTSGTSNIAVGYQAQYGLTTGGSNAGIGYQAQHSLTTGSYNTAVGYQAQQALTTGSNNTALGYQAQQALTSGASNTALGTQAQYSITTGSGGVGVGYQAQRLLTSGSNDTAIGYQAQYSLTTGSYNTAVGYQAQQALTSGGFNTAIGHAVQYAMTTAVGNTAVGYATHNTVTGSNNTAIGYQAGYTDGTTATTATVANTTLLGNRAQALVSDVCVIGSTTARQSLCLGNYGDQLGGGRGVFALSNASVLPTTNPAGGGVMYSDAGSLKWRGSAGTVTTLAVA